MINYELVYIVSDVVADDAVAEVTAEVAKEIDRLKGVITREEPWGKRRLAYPIKHRQYGNYNVVELQLEPKATGELDRFLRLQPNVLRHLLVAVRQPAVKIADENEVEQALTERVEQKQTAAASTVDEEKPAPAKRGRRKKADDEQHKEAEEVERKKKVEEKLSQLLEE